LWQGERPVERVRQLKKGTDEKTEIIKHVVMQRLKKHWMATKEKKRENKKDN